MFLCCVSSWRDHLHFKCNSNPISNLFILFSGLFFSSLLFSDPFLSFRPSRLSPSPPCYTESVSVKYNNNSCRLHSIFMGNCVRHCHHINAARLALVVRSWAQNLFYFISFFSFKCVVDIVAVYSMHQCRSVVWVRIISSLNETHGIVVVGAVNTVKKNHSYEMKRMCMNVIWVLVWGYRAIIHEWK